MPFTSAATIYMAASLCVLLFPPFQLSTLGTTFHLGFHPMLLDNNRSNQLGEINLGLLLLIEAQLAAWAGISYYLFKRVERAAST